MRNKKVFISGGAGVIGTALVQRLLESGADITVGDLKPRPSDWPSSVQYIQGDLNHITKEELLAIQPEYFFHLAASFERTKETYEYWGDNYHHNVKLSHHLIDCLKESPSLKKVIFASSYLIYHSNLYEFSTEPEEIIRLKENNAIYPRNLTGMAKLMHEVELDFLSDFDECKFETVSARIFRVYGKNSKDIVSRWIRSLLNNEEIKVYRKEGKFDYIFADDVAEGLLKLAVSNVTGIINLGNDNARKVEDVVNVLKKHFPHMKASEVESDILFEASQADMGRFEKLLNWKPVHQLEDAMPKIIEFEKNRIVNEKEKSNVLITSVAKKVSLVQQVKKATEKAGFIEKVYGGDLDSDCIASYFTDAFWEMPPLSKLPVNKLISYCKDHNISCIIPSRDGELSYFAQYENMLRESGIFVMISSLEKVELTLDKYAFSNLLIEKGFPAVPSYLDVSDTVANQKIVVKERFGFGSKDVGLSLDGEAARHHALKLDQPIFQPFIKGIEYSIDLYVMRNGEVKGSIARKRDLVVNGESFVTTIVNKPELNHLAEKIAEDLKLYGHVMLQIIEDHEGNYHIIECNARFGGASSASVHAGLDSFYWFLMESQGQDLSDYCFIKKDTKRIVKYVDEYII